MSSPQGAEAVASPGGDPRIWGPYGMSGWRLDIHASELPRVLPAPHGEVPISDGLPTWVDGDRLAFSVYSDFRLELDLVESNEGIAELLREVDLLHAALPFSEGERRWLLDVKDGLGVSLRTVPGLHLPESIVGVETTIISNGLRQVVKGRELVRRWAAWRRETDEFAGQGTVEEAQRHAREISRLVRPAHDSSDPPEDA